MEIKRRDKDERTNKEWSFSTKSRETIAFLTIVVGPIVGTIIYFIHH